MSGDYAFVANENGLVSIDISDPSAPVIMGEYETEEVSYYIAVDGYYAYLTRLGYGMDIINVSDPTSPSLVSSLDGINSPRDIRFSNEYIYMADAADGLVIVDVSDRSTSVVTGSFDEVGSATAVDVRGATAYVISYLELLYRQTFLCQIRQSTLRHTGDLLQQFLIPT
ncbi:hypothetical protein NBRC116494_30270 [Aurantivibrio plasticivorans]